VISGSACNGPEKTNIKLGTASETQRATFLIIYSFLGWVMNQLDCRALNNGPPLPFQVSNRTWSDLVFQTRKAGVTAVQQAFRLLRLSTHKSASQQAIGHVGSRRRRENAPIVCSSHSTLGSVGLLVLVLFP
jgi:hypothetical protein